MTEALKHHKEQQEKTIEQLSDAYHNQNFIFAKTERQPGYPILIKTVQLRMARLLALAKLKPRINPTLFTTYTYIASCRGHFSLNGFFVAT